MTNHHQTIEDEIEKKSRRRLKKKKPTMKVSGRSVKDLQDIIIKKSRLDKGG